MAIAIAPQSTIQGQTTEAEGIDFFESKIRPVLARECYGCHSKQTGQTKGGLTVDTKTGLLLGGDSGPAIVPGSLEDSPLWSAINYEDFNMPPRNPLSADIIEDFRAWIEMGAPDPRGQTKKKVVSAVVTEADIEKGREFWSYQNPTMPTRPSLATKGWSHGPIDDFVLGKLEEKSLQPATDADPYTLLRRLYFDLIGLPPTPDQIEAFLGSWENDPDRAVSAIVDELLDSERFGERWGRHWLDIARYAESSGKEVNATFPHAWRYRDYVIDSFNEDKPYDRFVQEQVAGDLLPVQTDKQWSENLIATGFLAIGPKTLTEQNPRQFRADLIDEQIDVTTRVILGVSVACARCHDHKFDPIPQSDYYAMAGIFASTDTWYGTLDTRQNRRPSDLILLPTEDPNPFDKPLRESDVELLRKELVAVREKYRELARLRREIRRNPNPTKEMQQSVRQYNQTGAQVSAIQSLLDGYKEDGSPKSFCMGVQPAEQPVDANLLVRGEVDQPAQEIPRGFVSVIGNNESISGDSSGRLELARWMTDKSNPLTARVMSNRIWQHLLGQGIVETPENFGSTGLPPTNPELLDYLAISFMKNNWSVKSLIGEIAKSRTYRMSSTFDKDNYAIDPENKLMWRASPRRLTAEAIRDAMLQIAGTLETNRPRASEVARGGSTISRDGRMRNSRDSILQLVNVRDDEMQDGDSNMSGRRSDRKGRAQRARNRNAQAPSADPVASYRSVYLPVIRDNVPRSLAVFDFAETSMVIGQRESSNTPDQGLYFLNNQTVIDLSETLAKRLMKLTDDTDEQIVQAFLMAYGRDATESELQAASQFLKEFQAESSGRQGKIQKLTCLCQAIMATAEFRIVN